MERNEATITAYAGNWNGPMGRSGSITIAPATAAAVRPRGGEGGDQRRDNSNGRRHRNQHRVDLFSAPGFNVQTGRRLPRFRRASLHSLTHVPTLPPAPAPAPHELDLSKLKYLFNKQLRKSDVSGLRRIVLPKSEAEAHLPVLERKEGIAISMLDMDGIHEWWFKFRYWPNNSSRMYVLESTGDFVYTHGLVTFDYILVYQNVESRLYVIEARKKEDGDAPRILDDGICTADMTFPEVPPQDGTGMLYEYDTTFLDDFLGGSANLPSRGTDMFFDPIENYNAEDFQ